MILSLLRKCYLWLNKNIITINGEKVAIPTDLFSFFSLRANNPIEPELVQFVRDNLEKGDVFVDVGANIGLVALEASRKVGSSGLVLALEPNPWVFKKLVEVQQLNKCENIRSLELAASDSKDLGVLHMNSIDSMLMTRSSMQFKDEGAVAVKVFVGRIDDICSTAGNIKLLKIDVEGAEMAVLKGARELIKSNRPLVCIEIHGLFFDNPNKHVQEIFTYFADLDFQCYNLHKNALEDAVGFSKDTGMHGRDDISQEEFAKVGYGQVVFYPKDVKITKR